MPNSIDNTGLTLKTNQELVDDVTAKLKLIYGDDISLASNSPDGQLLRIFLQVVTDMLEMVRSVYNSFDPDQASGAILDQRVAINGIARTAGTYTLAPVSVTVDRAMTLYGLDDTGGNTLFTVADGSGNQFYLQATYVFGAAGTASLTFRAKDVGAVEVLQNTITNLVSIILGVTAVNNPLAATSIGVDEETDVKLKLRRAASFMLPALGPADAIQAALLEVTGVTDAVVIDNPTSGEVGGVPANSIWAIVENGADADIADVIYQKKAAGCGMFGGEEVVVVRPNGQTQTIKFDRPTNQDLYVEFTINPKTSGLSFDHDFIKAELAARMLYTIGQRATLNDLMLLMNEIEPQAYLTAAGVSDDGGTPLDEVDPTDAQHKFVLLVANITINVPA